MPGDPATILDIIIACRRLQRFVKGVEKEEFLANEEKHWAVVSQLLVIGEAAGRLSRRFRANHPDIPWPRIIRMRNRLIHQYDKINWVLVWKTISEEIPALLANLSQEAPSDQKMAKPTKSKDQDEPE